MLSCLPLLQKGTTVTYVSYNWLVICLQTLANKIYTTVESPTPVNSDYLLGQWPLLTIQ